MQPNFDLRRRSEIRISEQNTKFIRYFLLFLGTWGTELAVGGEIFGAQETHHLYDADVFFLGRLVLGQEDDNLVEQVVLGLMTIDGDASVADDGLEALIGAQVSLGRR